jgi:predicted GTPase
MSYLRHIHRPGNCTHVVHSVSRMVRDRKEPDRYTPVEPKIANKKIAKKIAKKKPKKKSVTGPRIRLPEQLPEEKFEINAIEDVVYVDGKPIYLISFINWLPEYDRWYMEETLLLDVTKKGLADLLEEYKEAQKRPVADDTESDEE